MNIDANFQPLTTNCQSYAENLCQGSQNINKYTMCWVPAMEQCSYQMKVDLSRSDQGECYIEGELTTEVVCFLDICVNVSHMQYNLVC